MADWKQAFDVINTALGVISAAGNTPGINLIPYVSTVAAAANALQAGLNAGVKITSRVIAIKDTFVPGAGLPSQDKIDALNAEIAALEAEVDAALPAPEPGEKE